MAITKFHLIFFSCWLHWRTRRCSGAVGLGEGAGLAVAVVAAVGDDAHFVAVAAAAVVRGPAAFRAAVHHTGVGDVRTAGVCFGRRRGTGGDEGDGEEGGGFHGDVF